MYSHCSLGALLRPVARRRYRVANVLREVLGGLALLTAPCFVSAADAQAASGRITGTATDSATGRPLVGVQIGVTGTRFRAVTDDAGRYAIGGVPLGTHALEARRVGYRRATMTVRLEGEAAQADFRLAVAPLTLEAVVTTGVVDPTSGTRVPFTVGRISAEDAPVPAANAIETIQGKVAGVTIIPEGQAGSGTEIRLRSPTSINKSNSPLIVVDGVILSQSFDGSTADLESIDVESVEVIKGAAAASLYGSRAASGVVQIRTRRGTGIPEGRTRVTTRSELGMNSLPRKIKWAEHHYYMVNSAGKYVDAAGQEVRREQRVAKPVYARFQDIPYDTTIYDQVDRFFDPGQFYKNSVNVAQRTARTNWFLSLVNTREDGVVLNSGKFEQNDVRLNLDHSLRDNLSLSFSGYHARSHRRELYGDTFFDLINQAPDVDLRTPDPDGTPFRYQGDSEGREENPLYVLATEDHQRRRVRTQGSLEGRYSPLSWLRLDANVSYDRSDRKISFFLDQGVKTEGFAQGGPGEIRDSSGTTDALNAAASANLIGRRGLLTVRSTLRAMMERESNLITLAEGEVLSVPGVRNLNNAQQRFAISVDEDIRSNAYFATLGADWDGRYIVDGLVRRDGSSLFGPDERWNTYYRVSGAYRLAEESWWPWRAFTELKLRASRGTAGGRPNFNDQFETFTFLPGGGLEKQTLGNRTLKPEHATETEVGLDAILRNRYSVQLSYARSRVEDQLVQIPLAGFFGYTSQWQNAGTIEGNSIEATIEAQLIRRPSFDWTLRLVADRSRHKVTKFDRSCFQREEIAFLCAGETLGAMYGFRFIKSTAELPADALTRASEFQVNDEGLLVWVGANNTYREGETKQLWGTTATIGAANYGWGMPITLRDEGGSAAVVKIGDGNPDFRFGVSNSLTWRDISLFTLVDVQVGGDIYNQTNQRMYQWARSADVDQVGKPQDLKKPIEYYVALYSAADPTDYFVEDAGYVKLREVSLRYRFGRRVMNALARFGATDAGISLIGRNLLTFTDYKGYDPEVRGDATGADAVRPIVRIDNFVYPRYRTITGSLDITF